jgi:hypothetical protein
VLRHVGMWLVSDMRRWVDVGYMRGNLLMVRLRHNVWRLRRIDGTSYTELWLRKHLFPPLVPILLRSRPRGECNKCRLNIVVGISSDFLPRRICGR